MWRGCCYATTLCLSLAIFCGLPLYLNSSSEEASIGAARREGREPDDGVGALFDAEVGALASHAGAHPAGAGGVYQDVALCCEVIQELWHCLLRWWFVPDEENIREGEAKRLVLGIFFVTPQEQEVSRPQLI